MGSKKSTLHLSIESNGSKIYGCFMRIPGYRLKSLGGLGARLICTIGTLSYPCALMSDGKGNGYIMLNKTRMKQLQLAEGMVLEVTLEQDTSPYGMPMSEELEAVLDSDPEAYSRFENLTPGKQRNIIHHVSSVKSSNLRIERAIKLLNNLKMLPPGKERVRDIFLGPGS